MRIILIVYSSVRNNVAVVTPTKNISFDEMKDEILSGASLNRFVTHDDLAEQAHFLCSPLGKNISGQAISVCGNIEKAG